MGLLLAVCISELLHFFAFAVRFLDELLGWRCDGVYCVLDGARHLLDAISLLRFISIWFLLADGAASFLVQITWRGLLRLQALRAAKNGLLTDVYDIEVLPVDVLRIGGILLREEAGAVRVVLVRVKRVCVICLIGLYLLNLLYLLLIIIRKHSELLNRLLIHVSHIQIIHIKAFEFLHKY